jgi:hypothetical protein
MSKSWEKGTRALHSNRTGRNHHGGVRFLSYRGSGSGDGRANGRHAVGTALYAVPFDLNRLAVAGAARPVMTTSRSGSLAISRRRSLRPERSFTCQRSRRGRWESQPGVGGTGRGVIESIEAPRRPYLYPRLSPDGTQVVFNELVRREGRNIRILTLTPTPYAEALGGHSVRGTWWRDITGRAVAGVRIERLRPVRNFRQAFSGGR